MKSPISCNVFFLVVCLFSISFYSKAQQISEEWIQLEDSMYPRIEAISAVVDGKIYIFSGFTAYIPPTEDIEDQLLITSSSEVFDPSNIDAEGGPWKDLAPMPVAVTHSSAVVIGNEIWISGGFAGNSPGYSIDKVQLYNTLTDTWSEGPDLPQPMASHGMSRIGDHIHVYGGLEPDRRTDVEAHFYLDLNDLSAGWKTAAPLPKARNHFGTVSLKGKIYVVGGQHGHDEVWEDLPYVHVYDPRTDSWEELAELPGVRSHFEPATIAVDGNIIISGGRNQNDDNIYNDIIEYDPDADIWSEIDSLPKRMLAPVAKIINNQLFVSHGGYNWREPYQSAFIKNFTRKENDQLGFSPTQFYVELNPDSLHNDSIYIWTLAEPVAYTFNLENIPEWIIVDEISIENNTNPNSRKVTLTIDTEGINAGEYEFTLVASAPGYEDALLPIKLKVNGEVEAPEEPEEPELPEEPGEIITDVNGEVNTAPYIKLYPNPNNGEKLLVEIAGIKPGELWYLQLFNANGKLIHEITTVANHEGVLLYEFNESYLLSSGLYFISASSKFTTLKSSVIFN